MFVIGIETRQETWEKFMFQAYELKECFVTIIRLSKKKFRGWFDHAGLAYQNRFLSQQILKKWLRPSLIRHLSKLNTIIVDECNECIM